MTIAFICEGAEETLAKVEACGRKGMVVTADLGNLSDIRSLVAYGIEHFGKLDILVNNAGLEKNADFKGSDTRRL